MLHTISLFKQIGAEIDKLAELTADNPPSRIALRSYARFRIEKLQELANTIALYQAGRDDDARSLVLTNRRPAHDGQDSYPRLGDGQR